MIPILIIKVLALKTIDEINYYYYYYYLARQTARPILTPALATECRPELELSLKNLLVLTE